MAILNYEPPTYMAIIPSQRVTNGMVARIPAQHYERYITRIALNSLNLTSADLANPSSWLGPQVQTVIVEIYIGTTTTLSTVVDFTQLGDKNVAEYPVPILIPKETDFYIFWADLLQASASKVSAVVGLRR